MQDEPYRDVTAPSPQKSERRMWTLCANMRPGCEGAPMVRDGPPIKLYDHIPVVPCDEQAVERVAAELCRQRGWDWANAGDGVQAALRNSAALVLVAAGETP